MYRGRLSPMRSSRIDHSRVPTSVERLVWPLQEYKIIERLAVFQQRMMLCVFAMQQISR